MTEEQQSRPLRYVELTRLRKARFLVTNRRGGSIEVGEGDDEEFTPVELLLTAIAACTGMDVDYIISKRAEPDRMDLRITSDKVRDDDGNHLTDITVTFAVEFPEGEAGDLARDALPVAIKRSHDRLCTVSRTVELGTPVVAQMAADG